MSTNTETDASARSMMPASGVALRPLAGMVLAGLAAMLACGLLFWPSPYPWFVPESRVEKVDPNAGPALGETPEQAADRHRMDRKNFAFAVALAGAMIGGMLGMAEGVGRRQAAAVIRLGAAGILIGAVGGCAGGVVGQLVSIRYEQQFVTASITPTIMIQCATLAPLGIGIGLLIGGSTGKIRVTVKLVTAGFLAGVLAAVAYGILTAALFPNAHTNGVVPEGSGFSLVGSYLLWLGLAGLSIGFVVPAVVPADVPAADQDDSA